MEVREKLPDPQAFAARFRSIEENVEKVVRGKHHEIRLALVALIAEGHLLIEDVPGVGKTMLAKSIARSIDCSFRRIQFTPDLLPTDVTGVNVFSQETGDFEFKPGAIFANIVLGDEINRASPKTQSALLECMEERQVTVDTETHTLGAPFIVIATQNPIEHEGTYPLPEAQLDRFMLRLAIGYPSADVEVEILGSHAAGAPLEDISPVSDAAGVRSMIEDARRVHAAPAIRRYIVRPRRGDPPTLRRLPGREPSGLDHDPARRPRPGGRRGAGLRDPRRREDPGAPALSHRIIVTADAIMSGRSADVLVKEIVDEVDVPVAENP